MEDSQGRFSIENYAGQPRDMSSESPVLSAEYEEPIPNLLLDDAKIKAKHCVLMDLLANSLSGASNQDLFTLCPTKLCTDCALCNIMRECRNQSFSQDGTLALVEKDVPAAPRFWARVDMVSNNLYWTASQDNGDTTYPITRFLHRDAILKHPFMQEPSSIFKLAHSDDKQIIPPNSESSQMLSSIQAEELRLIQSLICSANHYNELAFTSRACSKLEALNILDNINRSLRFLWLAEISCRKAVLDDDML